VAPAIALLGGWTPCNVTVSCKVVFLRLRLRDVALTDDDATWVGQTSSSALAAAPRPSWTEVTERCQNTLGRRRRDQRKARAQRVEVFWRGHGVLHLHPEFRIPLYELCLDDVVGWGAVLHRKRSRMKTGEVGVARSQGSCAIAIFTVIFHPQCRQSRVSRHPQRSLTALNNVSSSSMLGKQSEATLTLFVVASSWDRN
jgi:hypothetical protein